MAQRKAAVLAIAKKYIAHLRKNGIRVERAYLYGSYANGKPDKNSDIDLVVVSRQFRKSRFDDSVWISNRMLKNSFELPRPSSPPCGLAGRSWARVTN